jgi:hypothetical protein
MTRDHTTYERCGEASIEMGLDVSVLGYVTLFYPRPTTSKSKRLKRDRVRHKHTFGINEVDIGYG